MLEIKSLWKNKMLLLLSFINKAQLHDNMQVCFSPVPIKIRLKYFLQIQNELTRLLQLNSLLDPNYRSFWRNRNLVPILWHELRLLRHEKSEKFPERWRICLFWRMFCLTTSPNRFYWPAIKLRSSKKELCYYLFFSKHFLYVPWTFVFRK